MKDVNILTNNGVNVAQSLELFGDMEMYDETLKDFLDMVEGKLQSLENRKAMSDMVNYAIEVHALKSDARYLGFTTLADLSYESELKSKAGDIMFVQENHPKIIAEARRMIDISKQYLGLAPAAPVQAQPAAPVAEAQAAQPMAQPQVAMPQPAAAPVQPPVQQPTMQPIEQAQAPVGANLMEQALAQQPAAAVQPTVAAQPMPASQPVMPGQPMAQPQVAMPQPAAAPVQPMAQPVPAQPAPTQEPQVQFFPADNPAPQVQFFPAGNVQQPMMPGQPMMQPGYPMPAAPAPVPGGPKEGTILIVDDSSLVSNFVKKIFDSRYNVLTAEDGAKAIELLDQEDIRKEIKACLLDLNMPNVD